jgi:hypothetical protein
VTIRRHEIAVLLGAREMSREALQARRRIPKGSVLVQIHDGEHYEIIAGSAYDFIDED